MDWLKEVFSQFNPVDIVFIGIIIIFAIRGAYRGFIETVLNAAALLGGLIVGWLLYAPFAGFLVKIGIIKLVNVAAFLIIFIVVYLIIKWIEHVVKRVTENKSVSNLDKVLGFLAGAVQGTILLILFTLVTVNVIDPFFNISQYFQGSILFELIQNMFSTMFLEGGDHIV